MPTLQTRQDGCRYVRHFYRDHSTWQLTGDGVLFLSHRGFSDEGQLFSTDLFMELWTRGLVYYGAHPPAGERVPCLDSSTTAALRAQVEALYKAVFRADVEIAWQVVRDGEQAEAQAPDVFARYLGQYRLATWKLQDLIVYDLSPDGRKRLGADRIGVVYLRIRLRDDSEPRQLEHFCIQTNGVWRVSWNAPFGNSEATPDVPEPETGVRIEFRRGGAAFSAEAFLGLAGRVWPRDYDLAQATEAVNRTINIGAWVGDRLVGSVRVLSDGYLFSAVPEVMVDPEFQRQGIGRELMRRALEAAPGGQLFFGAVPGNEPFFERAGFQRGPIGFVGRHNSAATPPPSVT